MGPNESWQSEVEQQLRSLKDYSVNQSINQLAAQGQSNYDLPVRNNPQEDPTTTNETIWIRMTEKGTANGQIFYSWRRQIKVATANGYEWLDNGDSGTLDYYPATGLNNDDVPASGGIRYPAKWNADTSQWVFFSNQQSALGIQRWNQNVWVYGYFMDTPSINSCMSANLTKDTISLNAAIAVLTSKDTYPRNVPGRSYWKSPGLGIEWTTLALDRRGSGYAVDMNSTVASLVSAHVVSVTEFFVVGGFPAGTPDLNGEASYAGVMESISKNCFVPNVGWRYNGDGYYPSGTSENYYYDEVDPANPSYPTYYNEFDERYESFKYETYKRVVFKKYLANGTYNNQTNTITLTRVVASNNTINANNPWVYNYGPLKGTAGHYTFPACLTASPSNLLTSSNSVISIGWGNLSLATSNTTNANGPLVYP
jgi:hypothetical protein